MIDEEGRSLDQIGVPLLAMWQTWAITGETAERPLTDFCSYVADGYASNGIVFGCILARLSLFAEGTFAFAPFGAGDMFGSPALSILETPWPNGSTGELLARMEQDVSLAGNFYARRIGPNRLQRLRPDLVDILLERVRYDADTTYDDVIGYLYYPDGRGGPTELVLVDDMAHWSPIPDPLASYRGMSWLTPVVREINADQLMTAHKRMYFHNAATPNAWVKVAGRLDPDQRERLRAEIDLRHGGVENAHRTMILDAGADYTVVGGSLTESGFEAVQAAGENRIAVAANVPGIVAGLKEGLQAATYSNYEQAMRRFADLFARPQWRSAAAALAPLVDVPAGARLVVNTRDIAALKEGEQARAEVFRLQSEAVTKLVGIGFEPGSVTAAVRTYDLTQLVHTGKYPTTLYPDGADPAGSTKGRSTT